MSRRRRRRSGASAAVLVAVLFTACSWPQFQHDAAHTGHSPDESTVGTGNVGGLTRRFTAAAGAVTGGAVVVDGLAYVGTRTNRLVAYDAAGVAGCTGSPVVCTPRWRSGNLAGAIVGTPAVDGGTVFVAGLGERLYAFDAKGATGCNTAAIPTCTARWSADLRGEVRTSPTVADGVVYVTSFVGARQVLHAFDATGTTGCAGTPRVCTALWSANLPNVTVDAASKGPVAVADGRLYVPIARVVVQQVVIPAEVYVFDAAGVAGCSGTPKRCTPLWTARTGGSFVSAPSVAGGVLYVIDDKHLEAFDATGVAGCSGSPKVCTARWRSTVRTADPRENSGPAVAGGLVYAGAAGGLAAFDAAGVTGCSGTPKVCVPLWTTPVGSVSAPAVGNGVLYATGPGGLAAVDARGAVGCAGAPKVCNALWTAPGDFGASIPSIANGRVYVGAPDGLHVFALS